MYRKDYSLDEIVLNLTVSVVGGVVNGAGEARDRYRHYRRGNGTRQVYISGLADHRLKDADYLVELVEKKTAEIEAATQQEKEPSVAAVQ